MARPAATGLPFSEWPHEIAPQARILAKGIHAIHPGHRRAKKAGIDVTSIYQAPWIYKGLSLEAFILKHICPGL